MLTTVPQHELRALPFLDGEESTTWCTVTLELWIPYAFVTHSIRRKEVWISQTSILWREDDILDFCREIRRDRSRKITDISLLMPFDGDGGGEWRWIPIKELWSRHVPSSTRTYPMYVAKQGEKIGETASTEVEEAELLYRFTKARRAP